MPIIAIAVDNRNPISIAIHCQTEIIAAIANGWLCVEARVHLDLEQVNTPQRVGHDANEWCPFGNVLRSIRFPMHFGPHHTIGSTATRSLARGMGLGDGMTRALGNWLFHIVIRLAQMQFNRVLTIANYKVDII